MNDTIKFLQENDFTDLGAGIFYKKSKTDFGTFDIGCLCNCGHVSIRHVRSFSDDIVFPCPVCRTNSTHRQRTLKGFDLRNQVLTHIEKLKFIKETK